MTPFQILFTSRGFNAPIIPSSVGEGWWPLVSTLLDDIAALGDKPEIHQVKEKFGGLRFYVGAATPEVYQLIDAAEEQSQRICEECGEPGTNAPNARGWVLTLCERHRDAVS